MDVKSSIVAGPLSIWYNSRGRFRHNPAVFPDNPGQVIHPEQTGKTDNGCLFVFSYDFASRPAAAPAVYQRCTL